MGHERLGGRDISPSFGHRRAGLEVDHPWRAFVLGVPVRDVDLGAPSRYVEHHGASFGDDIGRTCARPCPAPDVPPVPVPGEPLSARRHRRPRPAAGSRVFISSAKVFLLASQPLQQDREKSTRGQTCRRHGAIDPARPRGTPEGHLVARLPDTDRVSLPPVESKVSTPSTPAGIVEGPSPLLTVHLPGDRLGRRRDRRDGVRSGAQTARH